MVLDPLRPTFERTVHGIAPEALTVRVAAALANPMHVHPHRRAGRHFLIWIPDGRRRTWSPWLHLDVQEAAEPEPSTEPTAVLSGRFTPAPSLWTGVMLTYLGLATLALGGALLGFSQWLVGEAPWGLWFLPATVPLALLILLTSRAGQSLARDQMTELKSVVERALGEDPAPPAG